MRAMVTGSTGLLETFWFPSRCRPRDVGFGEIHGKRDESLMKLQSNSAWRHSKGSRFPLRS
jgi:hypothetical protein